MRVRVNVAVAKELIERLRRELAGIRPKRMSHKATAAYLKLKYGPPDCKISVKK